MGFEVAANAADLPWVKAILAKQKWRDGLTDEEKANVGVGYWTAEEWQNLEAIAEHDKQYQQQQRFHQYQQQRRFHQYQQQRRFHQYQQQQRFHQYQQQQQHHHHHQQFSDPYYQHQYHQQQQFSDPYYPQDQYQQQQQHAIQRDPADVSYAQQVEVRADGRGALAQESNAPPSSATSLIAISSSEKSGAGYAVDLSAFPTLSVEDRQAMNDHETKCMQEGILPAEREGKRGGEDEGLGPRRLTVGKVPDVGLIQKQPQPPLSQAAQPQPHPPQEEAGGEDHEKEAVVVVGEAAMEVDVEEILQERKEGKRGDIQQEQLQQSQQQQGSLQQQHELPPEPQQQRQLPAPAQLEPWPPPTLAEEGESGERSLELGRRGMRGGCGGDAFVGGCGDGDLPDGNVWERAGIGTGRSFSSSFVGWGKEPVGRRLTRTRRARVREK